MTGSEKVTNPLFVVTNKGKDVEAAKGVCDAFIKKYNLGPSLQVLDNFLDFVMEQLNSFASLSGFKEVYDQFVAEIKRLVDYIDELSIPVIKKIQQILNFGA